MIVTRKSLNKRHGLPLKTAIFTVALIFLMLSTSLILNKESILIRSSGDTHLFLGDSLPQALISHPGKVSFLQYPLVVSNNQHYLLRLRLGAHTETHVALISDANSLHLSKKERCKEKILIEDASEEIKDFYLSVDSGSVPTGSASLRVFSGESGNLVFYELEVTRISYVLLIFIYSAVLLFSFLGVTLLVWSLGIKQYKTVSLVFILGFILSIGLTAHRDPLVSDNRNYGMVARSIISDHNIDITEFSDRINSSHGYGVYIDGNKIFNVFPVGPSLILAPIYSLLSNEYKANQETTVSRIATALCYGISLSGMFILAINLSGSFLLALIICAIFGLSSLQLSLNAVGFWSHCPEVMFMILATISVRSSNKTTIFLTPLFLGLAYIMRPTAALYALFLSVYILFYRRRMLPSYIAGSIVAGSSVLSLNYGLYGSMISPYGSLARLNPDSISFAFIGNLFSPNRGLFVFIPWMPLSIMGFFISLLKRLDPIYLILAAYALTHIIVVSSFPHWWGGFSYGPRLLVETMIPLSLLTIPIIMSAWRSEYSKALNLVFLTLIFVAFLIQVAGLNYLTAEWNATPISVDEMPSRLWDWSDMQILRFMRTTN